MSNTQTIVDLLKTGLTPEQVVLLLTGWDVAEIALLRQDVNVLN